MSEPFDPYNRWLGILPEEQPPHHYRLLGVGLFESDAEVIDSVAARHMAYLQEITDGPHVKEAQRLLNELARARRCLLDPDKKAAYDEVWENDEGKSSFDSCTRMKRKYRHALEKPRKETKAK